MGFYGLAASLFAVAVAISAAVGYSKGAASRNPEIVELQAAIEASKRIAAEWEATAAANAAKVVTVFKDRVKVIKEREPAEVQLIEVIRAETPDSCLLPPAYRELWDGRTPSDRANAEGAPGTAGAPVAVADAAETAAEARRRFELNSAKLEALQALVVAQ